MNHSFEVFHKKNLIFFSDRNWLHPLFEFETFLLSQNYETSELSVKDKIVGRAAALLCVRLGIKNIHAGLLSQLGKDVLEHYGINYSYDSLVDRIICHTEELLKNEYDFEKAYILLKKRAGIE